MLALKLKSYIATMFCNLECTVVTITICSCVKIKVITSATRGNEKNVIQTDTNTINGSTERK